MTLMAVDTGGRPIMDTNALDVGLANAVKETSQYYVLGWHTNHDAEINRKKSRIELTLPGHPNLTARLGKSLRAPASVKKQPKKDESKTAKSPEAKLQETLVRALPSKQLPVSLDLVYQRADKAALLKTSIQVPIESLSFNNEEEKQKALIQVAALIYNDQGKVVQQFNKRMMLAAATANGVVSTDDSFTFKYEVPLPAGLYQVRAGIHDERSGRTGTAHEWIEIPNLLAPTLTLSSVISAEVSPHAANQTSPITLRANHHFRRDSSLRFLIYIYDPQLGQTDSKPDLVMQLQIFRDRQAAVTTPLRVISTTGFEALNEIPFEADLPLEQLAPGRYLMRVTVVDRANKMSASQQMRIEID
jgi:hypothetical protein